MSEVIPKMKIALSWSRLSDYLQCHHKFKLKYIDKDFKPEEKSIHLVKGEIIHKQLEDYLIHKIHGKPKPSDMAPAVLSTLPIVDKVLESYDQVLPESQVAVTYDFKLTEWFGNDVAWRTIMDFIAINKANRKGLIGDYKSGKVYDYTDSFGQLHLSAAIALSILPIDEVECSYFYVEHRKASSITVTKDELPVIKNHFTQLLHEVNDDKEFKATPNEFCKWCPATVGQCKYSRKLI